MRKLTIEELHRIGTEEFRAAQKMPLVIVLDNVRSLHNVGSVLRTADAFRLQEVCLCGITATPPSAEIHKTALGAEDSVHWTYWQDTLDCVAELKSRGYHVVAVEQVEGSSKLGEWTPVVQSGSAEEQGGVALVLGNEVKGVRQDVVDAADEALEIPQYGTKHSLNVSVTAGIVIWETVRQMQRYIRLSVLALLYIIGLTTYAHPAPSPYDLPIKGETAARSERVPGAVKDTLPDMALPLTLQVGKVAYKGDSIPRVILPTLYKYPPKNFKSDKQRQEYNRLVRNVKKILPLAKLARHTIIETYDYLETLPNKKARDEHLKNVEAGLKKQYMPLVKTMTRSQGKLFVKLIDRECDQTGYAIAKAFIGAFKANIYQGIAFLFGQSLTKHYEPEGEDAEVERIVRLVESGQL